MNGVSFEMSRVLETYRVKLHSLGYVNANKYGAEKLKSRLQEHFRVKSITFRASVAPNCSKLFCSSSVDLKTTMNKISELRHKLRQIATDCNFDVVGE